MFSSRKRRSSIRQREFGFATGRIREYRVEARTTNRRLFACVRMLRVYRRLPDRRTALPEQVTMPPCRIRLDIAHIIKMIARWQCFRGKAPRIKDFYLRCVGFLTTIESKDRFEEILHSILIVALSKCDDQDTECANKQEFLLNIIRKFTIDEKENSDEKNDFNDNHPSLNEIDAATDDDHLFHFDKLCASAKNSAAKTHLGQRLNAYYCPDFITPFMRFATYYVLWTNVMMPKTELPKYSVASSARSEAYFNDIKNITFDDEGKSIRADKFIIKNMCALSTVSAKLNGQRSTIALLVKSP